MISKIYKSFPDGKRILYGWFEAMHTRFDIILCDIDEEQGNHLMHKIHLEMDLLSKMLNRFDAESELALLNEKAFYEDVIVSDKLFDLITFCIDAHKLTFGYFDITVQSTCNYRDINMGIKFNHSKKTVRFNEKGICLDLCGVAKGYAIDSSKDILLSNGVENMFISFGNSSILGWGNHPYGKGWKVSLSDKTISNEITLFNECLTVSGNDNIGRKHIINPFNHNYIEGVRKEIVKSPNGLYGEVFSTACFIAPDEDKIKLFQVLQNLSLDPTQYSQK